MTELLQRLNAPDNAGLLNRLNAAPVRPTTLAPMATRSITQTRIAARQKLDVGSIEDIQASPLPTDLILKGSIGG